MHQHQAFQRHHPATRARDAGGDGADERLEAGRGGADLAVDEESVLWIDGVLVVVCGFDDGCLEEVVSRDEASSVLESHGSSFPYIHLPRFWFFKTFLFSFSLYKFEIFAGF